jgi:hypothetical protein
MSTSTLDPVIHHPERLRIAATLVALPQGDGLTVTRLQGMLGLTSAACPPACAPSTRRVSAPATVPVTMLQMAARQVPASGRL